MFRVTAPVFPATLVTGMRGWLIHAKSPVPLVLKTCPALPSAAGNVHVVDCGKLSGALRPREFVPDLSVSFKVLAVVPSPLTVIPPVVVMAPVVSKAVDPEIVPEVMASPETFPGVVIGESLMSVTAPSTISIEVILFLRAKVPRALLSALKPRPTST